MRQSGMEHCMLSPFPSIPLKNFLRWLRPLPFLLLALPAHAAGAGAAQQWCRALDARLKSVELAPCLAEAWQAAPIRSVKGRALMALDVPPSAPAGNAPPLRILLIGGIHGDELSAVSIVFGWLPFLREGEARTRHWLVAPLANPDGLFARPSVRMNAHGVDLNRNFASPDWDADALRYWRQRTGSDPRRYPGKSAASEPETRWLSGEIARFKPNVIISVHAPYGLLDYDGRVREPRRFGHLLLNRLGVYPGSLGNFGGVHKGIPVITIELPRAGTMPSAKEQRKIWDDMQAWLGQHAAELCRGAH
jgi:hypothetical protein